MSDDGERRNDLGYKMTVAVVALIMGFFINVLTQQANAGVKTGAENSVKIAALESQYQNITSDLVEIKDLLRRRIPGG